MKLSEDMNHEKKKQNGSINISLVTIALLEVAERKAFVTYTTVKQIHARIYHEII